MSDIKINDVIYASSDSANITYKDTSVYNKLEELSASGSIDGIIVNVEIGNWVVNGDVWTNTIAIEGISASDVYDISLYDDYSEEQANAYDFLITSIDTFDNQIVLTASEKINVALSIILRGKVNLEDKNVFVSDLSATSIDYDNTKSGLDATNMQNAVDEIATMVNGLVVNVSADSWDLQEDGSYKKIITIEQLTGSETLDVCLYPGDIHSEEQIVAFSELLSSIETYNGFIVLTAVEKINVSFRIFLYGKVNFDKNNLVALTDNIIEIRKISEEEFNKKSDAEKAAGNYLVDDGEDDEFLSARNIEFDGSEIGIDADNVHDAISELNSKIDNYEPTQEQSGIISQFATSPGDGADDMLIEFPEVFNTIPTDFYCVDVEQSNMFKFTVKELTRSYAIVTVKSSLSWNSLNDFEWKAVAYNDGSSKIEWNLLNSVTGTTQINLPQSFNELLIIVNDINGNTSTMNVSKHFLTSTVKYLNGGYYINTQNFYSTRVDIIDTYVKLRVSNSAGTDNTTTAKLTVYYR